MKKFLCGFMIVLLLFGGLPVVKGYAQEENSDNVVDMITYEKIKALYDERSRLVLDWESNEERIHEIDAEVEALGVRKMSYQEVLEKFGAEAVPYIDLIETEKINWSDVRVVTNYAGQMVELQVIRATPATSDSPLFKSITKVEDKESMIEAVGKKLLSITALTGLGKIPKIGSALVNGIDFTDTIKSYSDIDTKTIENVKSIYSFEANAEEVSIWAKFQGSTDKTQELCYKGNYIEFSCAYIIKAPTKEGGEMKARQITGEECDVIESEGYENCESEAAKNFVFYKLYGQKLKPDDRVKKITVETFNKEMNFDAPLAEVTFMWSNEN